MPIEPLIQPVLFSLTQLCLQGRGSRWKAPCRCLLTGWIVRGEGKGNFITMKHWSRHCYVWAPVQANVVGEPQECFHINGGPSAFFVPIKCAQDCWVQTWSRLRNRHRKPSRIDSISIRFRFEPIRFEISKYRIVIYFFNFDFGIYICMFSEKSVLFRYYRNVTDSYRK
jgi:hypothetical protein